MNLQVIQMIAIVFFALAVPLTLVTLGLGQFFQKPRPPVSGTPASRSALEQAAWKNLQPPEAIPAP
ncbi:MAG: hypothetical protein M0Q93_10380 [Terrimicrobiaceae bacterium]|nr:hypothetical protein [Terrimicrobiaceae bacterium]